MKKYTADELRQCAAKQKGKSILEQFRDDLTMTTPPEGWYSVQELVKLLRVSRATIESRLQRQPVQKARYRARDGRNRAPVYHYKME